MQVFESVEEADQTDTRSEDSKPTKIPNGTVANGTCSPDSGHPSSRNFSITSGYSDHSFSTDDNASLETSKNALYLHMKAGSASGKKQSSLDSTLDNKRVEEELAVQDSMDTEVTANESLDDFLSMNESTEDILPDKEITALSVVEAWPDSEAEKESLVGSEDNLSEEPEMESLYPQLDSLVVIDATMSEVSPVSSTGVTYTVSIVEVYTSMGFMLTHLFETG